MGQSFDETGQRRTLSKRLKKTLAACAISGLFAIGGLAPVLAGGETRTISLYHIHTGESLTVTYMKDGRYVPSAMKKINYLLRDWRKDRTITIDPRTIDLVWELHEDLGSRAPINIVCGFRSAETNSMLHRIGRKVARESQHIRGKAIDFYLTDVPTQKIRNVALVRQLGGVGYYRSSGGHTGFLHVDSGHVRHWGPSISSSQMVQIFREGKKYLGRHMTGGGGSFSSDIQVASANTAKRALEQLQADKGGDYSDSSQSDLADLSDDAAATPAPVKPRPAPATNVNEAQMASLGDLSQDAAITPQKAKVPAVAADNADNIGDLLVDNSTTDTPVTRGRVIPRPRLKPIEIMLLAAANMKPEPRMIRINAASAPPPSQSGNDKPSPMADSLGTLMEAAASDDSVAAPAPVVALTRGKGSVVETTHKASAKSAAPVKPMIASAMGSDVNWWPQMFLQGDAAVRRNGKPPVIGNQPQDSLPKAAIIEDNDTGTTVVQEQQVASNKQDLAPADDNNGKGDLDPANSDPLMK